MGLDVDEARRHRQAGGVDQFGRVPAEIRPHGDDAAIADGEVAEPARGAGAVEQQPVADEHVMRHGISGVSARTARAPWSYDRDRDPPR
jgi:hypothetical protein